MLIELSGGFFLLKEEKKLERLELRITPLNRAYQKRFAASIWNREMQYQRYMDSVARRQQPMGNPPKMLFRERAIEQYIRGQGKDVLPRLSISVSLCAFLWILLGALLVAMWMIVLGLNRLVGGA